MQRISLIGIVILLLGPFSVSCAQAPEWSNGLVWYQICPERFRNGYITNEPNKERARGSEGRGLSSWTSYWYAKVQWEQ